MNFLIALQFLTRIPVPEIQFNDRHNFANSVKYYPLVGFVVGVLLLAAYFLLSGKLPGLVIAALILIFNILITGGLHLDGFMDSVDGLMSARSREQMLEIMKDSRVGAHSVWAVFSLLLIKYSLLASLTSTHLITGLLLMPVVSRWNVLFAMAFWPYAREIGLGKIFLAKDHSYSFVINGLVICLATIGFVGESGLIALAVTLLLTGLLNSYLVKKLDGLTGDTYGATIEFSEVVVLLMILLLTV